MALLEALKMSFQMLWEIFWALCLGFLISAAVQSVVSKDEMRALLPDSRPGTLIKACALGAASSSCSYAAVAIARSLVRKGADFTASMAFEFASTNLVVELSVLLIVLLGWQFMAAELVGGLLMVFLLAIMIRVVIQKKWIEEAREQAEKGVHGRMEGHASMDMSIDPAKGSILRRVFSPEGLTAISHTFVMDVMSVWVDIAAGLLIAGCLSAWVPTSVWRRFFLTGKSPMVQSLWGALIGPMVSVAAFVCSVGNIPLAVVLWKGGISFGGVISFIFADLVILPVLNIYRKYYGPRMAVLLFVISYAAMAAAGLIVEQLFSLLGLIPQRRVPTVMTDSPQLNYTFFLNLLFLCIAAGLVVRFLRTGGREMLAMMG